MANYGQRRMNCFILALSHDCFMFNEVFVIKNVNPWKRTSIVKN